MDLKGLNQTFISGLKPEFIDEIRMFRPKTLEHVFDLTHIQEEQTDWQ